MSARACECCAKRSDELLRCGRCRRVRYCSAPCQRQHWKVHKLCCKPTEPSQPANAVAQPVPTTTSPLPRHSTRHKPTLNAKDFPKELRDFTYYPHDECETNLLLFFHGVGDTPSNFLKLGRKFNIPQCSLLGIRAPCELPLGMGHGWFAHFNPNFSVIEAQPTEHRRLTGVVDTRKLLLRFVEILQSKGGWCLENIFLFGFSQGAITALDLAMHVAGEQRFGGVVCVSGSILHEMVVQRLYTEKFDADNASHVRLLGGPLGAQAGHTPILITHGGRDDVVPVNQAQEDVSALKAYLTLHGFYSPPIQLTILPNKAHQMISSQDESRAVLSFLSSLMPLRSLALEDDPDVVQL